MGWGWREVECWSKKREWPLSHHQTPPVCNWVRARAKRRIENINNWNCICICDMGVYNWGWGVGWVHFFSSAGWLLGIVSFGAISCFSTRKELLLFPWRLCDGECLAASLVIHTWQACSLEMFLGHHVASSEWAVLEFRLFLLTLSSKYKPRWSQ